jgi:hypothetical protein
MQAVTATMTSSLRNHDMEGFAAELLALLIDQVETGLPQRMVAHPRELNELIGSTVLATTARLRDCQACPLVPYQLFTTDGLAAEAESSEAVQRRFAAHHQAQQEASRAATGHVTAAMSLLELSRLLLQHCGDSPPDRARYPISQLAKGMLQSLKPLGTALLDWPALPNPPSSHAAHGVAQPAPGWQEQQYAAAKERRWHAKHLLNTVLSCIETVMSSDAGWEGIMGVSLGSLDTLRSGKEDPTMEVPNAVRKLQYLLSLVQRPELKVRFQQSQLPHVLACAGQTQ